MIRALAERVEREHGQHLRDSQRVEDRSALATNDGMSATISGGLDFESLVGGGARHPKRAEVPESGSAGWEEDVWGSMLGADVSLLLTIYKPCTRLNDIWRFS